MSHPRITVVTPSYNQGRFVEETILSVTGQQYPNLEYIVMDGGSTDDSPESIRRHEKGLAFWTSERDNGQADAINKGFDRATGDILCWLNSDDMYLPGALNHVAANLNPERPEILFGNCLHFVDGGELAYGSNVSMNHRESNLLLWDYIIQPSSFWTRKAWEAVGPLDASLHYGFDWDWFIRAKKAGVEFKPQDKYLSVYRIHEAHKTGTGGVKRVDELVAICTKHAGERYGKLLRACQARRARIAATQKWIRRLRLSRGDVGLLRLISPRLFAGFMDNEIRDVLNMV